MLHMRDVWVNWFEGEENGYNVCEFFEWRKEDRIELLDQVAVVKMYENLFDYIENSLQELPEELLADVYKQSYVRRKSQREELEYCFVATDGKRSIVIDTIGYHTPVRKSRLVPRQEEQLLNLVESEQPREYYMDYLDCEKEYHILSPDPRLMNGLIRKERLLKQLLFMVMDQLYHDAELPELRYWYTEWSPDKYSEIQAMNFDEVWNSLFEEIKHGWSKKHEDYCFTMIKGQPFFEKLWELHYGEAEKKNVR
ncbi:YjbA family protein [Evansella sp. AB-P1]|uniref:YjbA family protein n=1 Tax=Evansella sp. AB-P1 TaxID=3037653 RepID=UPI00241C240A|nr:YjbA family protein [Evansella sp. AB-P1]MDG5789144.1 YjbA family protein [Evansella sp. AB-P1]